MGELDDYADSLHAWTDALLGPYVERLATLPAEQGKEKEVNDPLWGTLVFSPLEVLFIDSPLIQRLRSIRQLGVVHLTYPSALHTRFEHVLGACHQVGRLISALNRSTEPEEAIDAETRRTLRLTALCHDVGHGLMSHVSQTMVRATTTGRRVERLFRREHGVEVQITEVAAHYIIHSKSFGDLVAQARRMCPKEYLPGNVVDQIANAVVGKPISDEVPLLHELITGPFDADKLDYMSRDALMSGVPVVTDIPRLVQKVRAVRVSQDNLPEEIAQYVRGGLTRYTLFGVGFSGARTLDELMLGRILLFDKLYRHQKVRATEVMVGAALDELAAIVGDADAAMLPYRFGDDEFLQLTQQTIENRLTSGTPLDVDAARHAAVACDIAARLRDRRLFVRAFAFAQNMPLDAYFADAEHWGGLTEVLSRARTADGRRQLVEELRAELAHVLSLLGKTVLLSPEIEAAFGAYVRVDPTTTPTDPGERAYLITDTGRAVRFRDEYAETAPWSRAYMSTRDLAYVFTTEELAEYVYIACETVFRQRYRVRLPDTMLPYCRQKPARVEAVKRELAALGYYADKFHDLRPRPERLRAADIPNRIKGIVTSLEGYDGPSRKSDTLGKSSLNQPDRVVAWIQQFDDDRLIGCALDMVGGVRIVKREDANRAVEEFVAAHPDFSEASVAPFGEPKDSSSIVTYQMEDLRDISDVTVRRLEDAIRFGKPIIFADDFVSSGRQSVTVVEAMLGLQPSYDLGEDRGAALEPDLIDALRHTPLAFVFAAGAAEGRDLLQGRLGELGLDARVHVGLTDLPRAFTGTLTEDEVAFRDRCAEIGRQLITSENHAQEWVDDRVLGYGNKAFLVVFPYNTPSQTLTCLWASGVVDGAPWLPLFPRRTKR